MSNSQLCSTDFNYEISPCEVPYNFEDTSQFQKLSFPEENGIRLNSLLQLAPNVATADIMSKAYVVRFPKGVQGTLISLKQGGQSVIMRGEHGRFTGTASLYEVRSDMVNLMNIFTVASFATGQYFLAHISTELSEIRKSIDDVLKFLNDDKRSQLIAELTFVKYAASNFSSIMLSESQRTATLTNLQHSKIAAVSNIEFYTTQLEDKIASKKSGKPSEQCAAVLQAKQTLDLAMQLYVMSSVMEVYYSQNWNKLYLENIHNDMKQVLTSSKNRMLRSLSAFGTTIQDAHKDVKVIGMSIPKGGYSEVENELFKTIDELSNKTELPLLELADDALQSPKKETKLYMTGDGDVYQKVV